MATNFPMGQGQGTTGGMSGAGGASQQTSGGQFGTQQGGGDFASSIKEGASEVLDSLKDVGGQVRERTQAGFESLRDNTTDYMDQGRMMAQDFGDSLERQIRAQPLTSVLVAVGVGFLVGAIWSRT